MFVVVGIVFTVAGMFTIGNFEVEKTSEKVDCFDKYGNQIIGATCLETNFGTTTDTLLLIMYMMLGGLSFGLAMVMGLESSD